MMVGKEETLSALVILRSSARGMPEPTAEITARTVAGHAPSADAAASAVRAFEKLGFEVGPLVGISFSITGPYRLFHDVFDILVERGEDGALVCLDASGAAAAELPTGSLPAAERALVASVVFEPPAELM
jgi:hypothetical protein